MNPAPRCPLDQDRPLDEWGGGAGGGISGLVAGWQVLPLSRGPTSDCEATPDPVLLHGVGLASSALQPSQPSCLM